MEIQPFQIESESEADEYLRDLLAKPEDRSMAEVERRAHQYIKSNEIRSYFTSKAVEMLSKPDVR